MSRAWLHSAPGISVRFTRLDPNSPDKLGDDSIDFLIMPSETESQFPFAPLFTDRWICVVWRGNRCGDRTLDMQLYLELPHLVFGLPGAENASLADSALERLGVRRNVIAWTESFILSPFLIRGTDMITLTHERIARRLGDKAEAKILEPPFALDDIHESLFWNPRRTTDPPHAWMREQVLAAAAEID